MKKRSVASRLPSRSEVPGPARCMWGKDEQSPALRCHPAHLVEVVQRHTGGFGGDEDSGDPTGIRLQQLLKPAQVVPEVTAIRVAVHDVRVALVLQVPVVPAVEPGREGERSSGVDPGQARRSAGGARPVRKKRARSAQGKISFNSSAVLVRSSFIVPGRIPPLRLSSSIMASTTGRKFIPSGAAPVHDVRSMYSCSSTSQNRAPSPRDGNSGIRASASQVWEEVTDRARFSKLGAGV